MKWREDGFLIWKSAIAPELIDQLNMELNELPNHHTAGLMMTGANFGEVFFCSSAYYKN